MSILGILPWRASVRAPATLSGRLPSFLVIGATKCGTTSLHGWLSRHPEVFMSPWKEMRFFMPGYRWAKGSDWYRAQFAGAGAARAVGEASNGYARGSEHPGVPERVRTLLPDVRLIYLIRDPMRRLVSHYRHRVATGRESGSPENAVRSDPAYVETGCYGKELERWLAIFPRAQLLVIRSEHLFADPAPELMRVARHIGVTPRPNIRLGTENRAVDRTAMPRPLRQAIGATGAWRTGRRMSRLLDGKRGMIPLSEIPVDLPESLTAELSRIYSEDRERLRRHVPERDCDWNLP